MELFIEVFRNPIMQSMIIGPIMGVVFAALFSGLSRRATTQEPTTVVQTEKVYVTRFVTQHSGRGGDSEASGVFIIFGFVALFIIWKYAIFVSQIHLCIE